MKTILTVIGARPQIIKAAAVSRTIADAYAHDLKEIIIHTGQHYDANMSQVFFDELNIPKPFYNLDIGSAPHAVQIEKMRDGLTQIIRNLKPDMLLVYGDTNSTHAAALAASDVDIPLAHIEAGLRSFNQNMPEETNRIVADKASTLLFVPTEKGLENLAVEGFRLKNIPPYNSKNPGIFHCGDVMYDNVLYFSDLAKKRSDILERTGVSGKEFLLATVHRDNNTDNPERLNSIFSAFVRIANDYSIPIVLPLHPRTKKAMEVYLNDKVKSVLTTSGLIRIIPPASYLDMILLESSTAMILTDSGGVQKEAFFFQKPCIILRSETEWGELVENGNALIADANEEKIISAFVQLRNKTGFTWPSYYGDGNASQFICNKIIEYFG